MGRLKLGIVNYSPRNSSLTFSRSNYQMLIKCGSRAEYFKGHWRGRYVSCYYWTASMCWCCIIRRKKTGGLTLTKCQAAHSHLHSLDLVDPCWIGYAPYLHLNPWRLHTYRCTVANIFTFCWRWKRSSGFCFIFDTFLLWLPKPSVH